MDAIAAGLEDLRDCVGRPFPKIIVEADSLEAISILNHVSDDCTKVRFLAEKVEHLVSEVGVVEFTYSQRESNLEAHVMTQLAATCFRSGSSSRFVFGFFHFGR